MSAIVRTFLPHLPEDMDPASLRAALSQCQGSSSQEATVMATASSASVVTPVSPGRSDRSHVSAEDRQDRHPPQVSSTIALPPQLAETSTITTPLQHQTVAEPKTPQVVAQQDGQMETGPVETQGKPEEMLLLDAHEPPRR